MCFVRLKHSIFNAKVACDLECGDRGTEIHEEQSRPNGRSTCEGMLLEVHEPLGAFVISPPQPRLARGGRFTSSSIHLWVAGRFSHVPSRAGNLLMKDLQTISCLKGKSYVKVGTACTASKPSDTPSREIGVSRQNHTFRHSPQES